MAIGGRKPKPSDLKRATGNPGKRPIVDTPQFAAGGLAVPKWFDANEKAEWARIVGELERLKIARGVHQGGLEGVCVLYAAWRQARKIKDASLTVRTYEAYRKALNEFGLTPASAGRVVAVEPDGHTDPEAEFFGPRLAS